VERLVGVWLDLVVSPTTSTSVTDSMGHQLRTWVAAELVASFVVLRETSASLLLIVNVAEMFMVA